MPEPPPLRAKSGGSVAHLRRETTARLQPPLSETAPHSQNCRRFEWISPTAGAGSAPERTDANTACSQATQASGTRRNGCGTKPQPLYSRRRPVVYSRPVGAA